MRSYILNTVSAFAPVAFAADNGEGGADMPRILPDLTQGDMGETVPEKTARLKAARIARDGDKPVKAKANKAKVSPTVAKGVAASLRESVEEASNKRRKISKAGPLLKPLHKLLSTGPKHIAVLAEKMKCGEQDVRGAIDTLRRIIHPVNGVRHLVNKPNGAPKTFGYRSGFKLSADMLKRL